MRSAGGFEFYQFPSLDRLALVSESKLRESGFGYRSDSNLVYVDHIVFECMNMFALICMDYVTLIDGY